MPSTKDLKLKPAPAFLIIGDGGTKKTTFLGTVPEILILDCDAGLAVLRDKEVNYETFKDAPYGVKVKPGTGIYEWGTAWPALIKYLNDKVWPQLEAGTFQSKALGLDSLTTLATQCMNYVLKSSGKTGSAQPEIQHWGSQLRLMETLMEQLAAWPIPLFVTAHIKRDENLTMGTKEYLPLVGGQLGGKIGIYFDEVYYTQIIGSGKDRKFTLRTESDTQYKQAKTRYNVPSGIETNWASVGKHFS